MAPTQEYLLLERCHRNAFWFTYNRMNTCIISAAHWVILCFLLAFVTKVKLNLLLKDEIAINCGSFQTSVALDGKRWLGDTTTYLNLTVKGSSTIGEPIVDVHSVPYKTVRISRSQFSYIFQVNSGQKLIRLHFNPVLYKGFERSEDLFTVTAGPFTLLNNFSASITAVNFLTKEFYINLQENYLLNITFSPESHVQDTYAFVNGIEIISVPETLSGVRVVGEELLVYIDNTTALELVHREISKRDSVSLNDDVQHMFNNNGKEINYTICRVSVDRGYGHLVRLHLCELGLRLADNYNASFLVLVNYIAVLSNTDILLGESEDNHRVIYMNYMVLGKACELEDECDIIISIQSNQEFINRHGPLKGFEIFKLRNHGNSFTSPNLLPPEQDLPFWINHNWLSVLSSRSGVSAVVIITICLVIHILRRNSEDNISKTENKLRTRITRTCRCFSLPEICTATENFNDAFVIGRGGFGKVFKGFIKPDQEIVAIKRLKLNSKQGKREFWTEIETLSEVRHVNLVSLIGYCNEQEEMILVYNYMPNGTLADHLYKLARKKSNYSFLSWEERLEICIGVGRGLDYLHTGKGIIHRDVKSSNILLDETFVAKVSDFGLAKTESFSQESTNLKGTFGYIDPDYFKTHKLTTKSDTYAFGVVLLEVLCGRPAVDPLARENERSLTTWAQDKISRGKVDKILAPSLSGVISPNSLKIFLKIVENCLLDEPNKRPAIAHVVINLEFALEKQNVNSLVPINKDFHHFSQYTDKPLNSSHLQNVTSLMEEQTHRGLVNNELIREKKDGQKSKMDKLSRLLPWDSLRNRAKEHVRISISAPISNHTRNNNKTPSRVNSTCQADGGNFELISTSNFRIFSLSELKVATSNFSAEKIITESGLGRVYNGILKEKSAKYNGCPTDIAVKRLSPKGMQRIGEWMSEINLLRNLSHPNLFKLLGYCYEDKELLFVYELAKKGNLEHHLFWKHSAIDTLSWHIRLKILIGAARGLSYLHNLEVPVVYRDFKTRNILLDESYNAKLSDTGLAKSNPPAVHNHVTSVMGTLDYAAPVYMATGHLTARSDTYGFGVVLLEMLTGLRSFDRRRSGQESLVERIKPCFDSKKKLMNFMDPRLEGNYPAKSVLRVYQLAKNCLEDNSEARPSMIKVFEILEAVANVEEPKHFNQ